MRYLILFGFAFGLFSAATVVSAQTAQQQTACNKVQGQAVRLQRDLDHSLDNVYRKLDKNDFDGASKELLNMQQKFYDGLNALSQPGGLCDGDQAWDEKSKELEGGVDTILHDTAGQIDRERKDFAAEMAQRIMAPYIGHTAEETHENIQAAIAASNAAAQQRIQQLAQQPFQWSWVAPRYISSQPLTMSTGVMVDDATAVTGNICIPLASPRNTPAKSKDHRVRPWA